jgi:hypothetical protein
MMTSANYSRRCLIRFSTFGYIRCYISTGLRFLLTPSAHFTTLRGSQSSPAKRSTSGRGSSGAVIHSTAICRFFIRKVCRERSGSLSMCAAVRTHRPQTLKTRSKDFGHVQRTSNRTARHIHRSSASLPPLDSILLTGITVSRPLSTTGRWRDSHSKPGLATPEVPNHAFWSNA